MIDNPKLRTRDEMTPPDDEEDEDERDQYRDDRDRYEEMIYELRRERE